MTLRVRCLILVFIDVELGNQKRIDSGVQVLVDVIARFDERQRHLVMGRVISNGFLGDHDVQFTTCSV